MEAIHTLAFRSNRSPAPVSKAAAAINIAELSTTAQATIRKSFQCLAFRPDPTPLQSDSLPAHTLSEGIVGLSTVGADAQYSPSVPALLMPSQSFDQVISHAHSLS